MFFYENLTIPVLRGASGVTANSSNGDTLGVTLSEPGRSPTVSASVSFHEPVFFGETYSFKLAYELSGVRVPSLFVTPAYVYLPLVAGGDEATVTITAPSGGGWSVSLEAGECAQDGTTFTCSGQDDAFLAALLEVSRPDAVTSLAFDVPLRTRTVSVSVTYFQGEGSTALHLKDLASAALPLMENLYGFSYPGLGSVSVAQGGRQSVLGYEGLTSCHPASGCSVVVSPAADDMTVLHELAHLWSSIYGKRWLSEGFAQLVAEEAAGAMPPGLVQSQPPEREPAAVDLRLDDWGEVSSLIGADESELDVENAGYDRSLRFLYLLRFELGSGVLQQVNTALAAEGAPADSGRYLDLIEELSGKRMDSLFAEWVFSPAVAPELAARRQTRERLELLAKRAADAGLSDEVPRAIRAEIDAWQFGTALAALDEAEGKLAEYDVLAEALSGLERDAEDVGLSFPSSISDAMEDWDFTRARRMLSDAERALEEYARARRRVDAGRSVWERIGLLGIDPDKDLERASEAFAAGDFDSAIDHADEAVETIDHASTTAFRRLLLLALVLAVFAGGIGLSVWIAQRRDREFFDF